MSNKSNNCKKIRNIPIDLIPIILGNPRPSLIVEDKDEDGDPSSHSLIFEDGGKEDENKLSFSAGKIGAGAEFVDTGNPSVQQQPCKRCNRGSSYNSLTCIVKQNTAICWLDFYKSLSISCFCHLSKSLTVA
jgi:hypothetical protein